VGAGVLVLAVVVEEREVVTGSGEDDGRLWTARDMANLERKRGRKGVRERRKGTKRAVA
jgi:hypothetical protein